MDILSVAFFLALCQIIWINIILSGDNAVVIALVANSLPQSQRSKAIFWGSGLAIVLRVLLTLAAAFLLTMPYLQIIGGLALLYIGVKLLIEEEEDEAGNKVSKTLMFAIWSILVADFSMSLDNILAVALAAKVNGHVNYILLLMGLVISIPIIMGAAAILTQLIDRFPIIKYIGALLIGWVAGDAIFHDPFSQGLLTKGETPGAIMAMEYLIKGACAVFVVGMGAASYFISHNPSTEP